MNKLLSAAALTAVYTPGEERVLLVEGDLSGIQEMLYTITSKGAWAKLNSKRPQMMPCGWCSTPSGGPG